MRIDIADRETRDVFDLFKRGERYGYVIIFSSRQIILSENAVLQKENEILLRKVGKKRVHFSFYDRFFFVVLNRAADIKNRLTLVKPDTVLVWQRTLIRRSWTFEHRVSQEGS